VNHALVNTAERARRRNAYAAAVLADSPSGYWRLEETTGTNLADASGNGRDATATGTFTLNQTGATATTQKATRFNTGSGQIADATWHRMNVSFTLECWVKIATDPAASTFPGLFNRGNSGSVGGWAAFYNSSRQLQYKRDNVSGFTALTNTVLPATASNAWTHVAITFDEPTTTLKVYFNGSVITSATNTTFAPGDTTTVAAFNFGRGDQSAQGDHYVDEVATYDAALSATRVLAHFNAA
jgi:hypothetical protein